MHQKKLPSLRRFDRFVLSSLTKKGAAFFSFDRSIIEYSTGKFVFTLTVSLLLFYRCVQMGPVVNVEKQDLVFFDDQQANDTVFKVTKLTEQKELTLDYAVAAAYLSDALGSVTKKEAQVRACDPTIPGTCFPVFPVTNRSYHFDGTLHYSAAEDVSKQPFVFINDQVGKLLCYSSVGNPFGDHPIRLGSGFFYDRRMLQVAASERNWRKKYLGQFMLFTFSLNPSCRMDTAHKICNCRVKWLESPLVGSQTAKMLRNANLEEEANSDSELEDDQTTGSDKSKTAKSKKAEIQKISLQINQLERSLYNIINDSHDLMTLPVILTVNEPMDRKDFSGVKKQTWSHQELFVYNLLAEDPWACPTHYSKCQKVPFRTQSLSLPQQCAATKDWLLCTPYPTDPPFHTRPKQDQLFVFSRALKLSKHFGNIAKVIPLPSEALGAVGISINKMRVYLAVPQEAKDAATNAGCNDWACSDGDGKQRILSYTLAL